MFPQQPQASHRALIAFAVVAQPLVGVGIAAVESHVHPAGLLSEGLAAHLLGDECAVGVEGHDETHAAQGGVDAVELRMAHRLAAGEQDEEGVELLQLLGDGQP